MVYIPNQAEILVIPEYNTFFRAPRYEDALVSQIANGARKNAGLDTSYIWKGIRAIAASPWNQSHIQYSINGYENYNIEGPQYLRKYSADPLSQPGSGNEYPVMWIPDPDNPVDPDYLLPAPPITMPESLVSYPDDLVTVREIPAEIIEEIADPKRDVIILEPMTSEAQQIALSVPGLPTDKQADLIIQATEIATDAQNILADPSATIADKKDAINVIADLATAAGIDAADIADDRKEYLNILDQQAQEITGQDVTPLITTLPLMEITGRVPGKISPAMPIVLLSFLGAIVTES